MDQQLRSEQRAARRSMDLDGRRATTTAASRAGAAGVDRYQTYSDGYHLAITEPGGLAFWNGGGGGTTCGNSPAVVGADRRRSTSALGGCTLGARRADDGGAGHARRHRPLQRVRERLDLLDRADRRVRGPRRRSATSGRRSAGRPASSAIRSPTRRRRPTASAATTCSRTARSTGRPTTGAHEVHGVIRDAYRRRRLGGRRARLPDLRRVRGRRRAAQSDFQHGSITWDASTGQATVTPNP